MSIAATRPDIRAGAEQGERMTAIALMCATMIFYAALDTTAKWLGLSLPLLQIVWARYVGATLIALVIGNPLTAPHRLRSNGLRLQLIRSGFLFGSTVLSFTAVRYLQLSETTAINFALPLAVALAAGPVLGEWVGPRRLAAIVFGFVGVLVVVQPWTGRVHPAMLLSVANVGFGAGYNMLTRLVAQRDTARTTLIYSTLSGAVLLTPIIPFVWVAPPGAAAWAGLVGIGTIGAIAHSLIILAHARAPASILAPFSYMQLIWMVLLGYLLFGDVPHRSTMLGAGIVVVSGLYLWHRERRDAVQLPRKAGS